jgi:hypothetical protein
MTVSNVIHRGSVFGRDIDFSLHHRWRPAPPSLLSSVYEALSAGVKRPRLDADHSPSAGAEL